MFLDILFKLGQVVKVIIGDLVYVVLIGNLVMSDGKIFFYVDYSNLFIGVVLVFFIDSLSKVKIQMVIQKVQVEKGKGCIFNICLGFVLILVVFEDKVNQIINFEFVLGVDVNSGIVNLICVFVQVIGELCLDDFLVSVWYMVVKKGFDIIEVVYLDGVDILYLE